jgi:hypothetical protein
MPRAIFRGTVEVRADEQVGKTESRSQGKEQGTNEARQGLTIDEKGERERTTMRERFKAFRRGRIKLCCKQLLPRSFILMQPERDSRADRPR